MENLVTVCTPTYNRAHTLERLYRSLKNQTNKNFVWLVIDDGSTDNTKEIVEKFISDADFLIEYHRKENGGRHTALNYSYQFIKSEFVINIDSDDELYSTAIERIEKIYNEIPLEERKRFWQISGRCIDNKEKKIVGSLFPNNINMLSGKKQRRVLANVSGEKSNCRKVEILRKNLFPIYEDTKFVTENIVWEKINREYDTYCTNEVFRIYYIDSDDSLAKGKMHSNTRMISRYHYSVFCLNELWDEILYNKNVGISIINIARASICASIPYKKIMKDLKGMLAKLSVTLIGYPIAYMYVVVKKEICKKEDAKNEK